MENNTDIVIAVLMCIAVANLVLSALFIYETVIL